MGDTVFQSFQNILGKLLQHNLDPFGTQFEKLENPVESDEYTRDQSLGDSYLDSEDDLPSGWYPGMRSQSMSSQTADSPSCSPAFCVSPADGVTSISIQSHTSPSSLVTPLSATPPPLSLGFGASDPSLSTTDGSCFLLPPSSSKDALHDATSSAAASDDESAPRVASGYSSDMEVRPSRAHEMLLQYQNIARGSNDVDNLPPWCILLMQDLGLDRADTRHYISSRNIHVLVQRLMQDVLTEQPRNAVDVIEGAIATLHQSMLHRRPHAAVQVALAALLRRPGLSGLFVSDRMPTPEEQVEIRAALQSLQPTLTAKQKSVLWDFRWYLANKAEGLPSILKAVDWTNSIQKADAVKLVEQWGVVKLEEAIELLGHTWKGIDEVRTAAISALQQLSEDDVLLILPQLVQALRYEREIRDSALMQFLLDATSKSFETSSFLSWHLGLESIYFPALCVAHELFLAHLVRSPSTQSWVARIMAEMRFTTELNRLYTKVRSYGGKERNAYLCQLLSDKEVFNLEPLVAQQLPLPLHPRLKITAVVPRLSRVYSSAQHPILLAFAVDMPNKVARVIFKKGDDLRQDQLVCQFIRLVDRLWKEEGCDLRMTPYRVLATGQDEGMVQVVPQAYSMAHVLKAHKSLRNFLRDHNYLEEAPDHIDPRALDNYIRSCAGYCIVTYVLGIGDRHLDNLLICPDGRTLHVDFGYMFGRDPKPFPPAMKISRDMLEVMGGTKGTLCQQFLEHCWTGYRILRQNAKLLCHLMTLMKDSELRCLDLAVSQQNMRLDLEDWQAKAHIQQVVCNSMSAFIPEIMDAIHDMAMRLREQSSARTLLTDRSVDLLMRLGS